MRLEAVSSFLDSMRTLTRKSVPDSASMLQDASLRALLTRIKYARIPRDMRDHYSKLVRGMAAEDKADQKFIKGILDIIYLMESTSGKTSRENEKGLTRPEKSVGQEMKLLVKERNARREERQRMDTLRQKISTLA